MRVCGIEQLVWQSQTQKANNYTQCFHEMQHNTAFKLMHIL